jgi:hypothetical protein
MSSYVFDSSNARLNLLHTLFAQQIANQMANSGGGLRRPMPPLRQPQTSNPFGFLRPTGGIAASATHGAGYTASGSSGQVSLVGPGTMAATPIIGTPIVAGGPVAGGPGGPRYSPPAQTPPPGMQPLPR